ncbi:MAG TPA: glycoside hydrolase family 43 protein [Bdellovibrionales bacterium]|nr:glycoside hydrolase family 43 protein [Bdellovibrionales bacterium]
MSGRLFLFGAALFLAWVPNAAAFSVALDEDFPDPAVLRAPNGRYYAYGTQGYVAGKLHNIQALVSNDLRAWRRLPDALPRKPKWASRTQQFWAPHVAEREGRYFMYFSAEPNTKDGLCLAVATSRTPEGPFRDSGRPLICGPGFEHIDPMLFTDPASRKTFLFWGSHHKPIRMRELRSDGLAFAEGSVAKPLLFPEKENGYRSLLEAPWVLHHAGYYYLFVSGDNCCEPGPRYAVLVARAKRLDGPYELRRDGAGAPWPVVSANARWLAPGHNSVVASGDAGLELFFHAIDRKRRWLERRINGDRQVRRVMVRASLGFQDGWPVATD